MKIALHSLITLDDKIRFFDDAVTNNYSIFFEHDLYNECCNLIETEKGVKTNKTFTLQEFINNN